MRLQVGGKAAGRAFLAASLAVMTAGAVTLVAAPTSAQPAGGQPSDPAVVEPAEPAIVHPAGPAVVEPAEPAIVRPAGPAVVEPAEPAIVRPAGPAVAVPAVPAPSEVVREVGSWFAHGYTLDLRQDGTGTFSVWLGALNGNKVQLRLIPAPGSATVAEVTAVERVGVGALGPDARPGVGGLVTILFGQDVRTAHLEWTSGPNRHAVDLCPAAGLDVATMEKLRCGA